MFHANFKNCTSRVTLTPIIISTATHQFYINDNDNIFILSSEAKEYPERKVCLVGLVVVGNSAYCLVTVVIFMGFGGTKK